MSLESKLLSRPQRLVRPLFSSYHFLTKELSDGRGGPVYTHKLAKGTGTPANYGIELAKASSLPREVVADAEEIAKEVALATKVRF